MKTVLYTLTLLAGISSLHAQHLFRQDSLGIGLDFPCAPEALQEDISTPAGTIQMKGYLCKSNAGDVYMFAYNSMQGMVESPDLVSATLHGAKNGMTGKLGAKIKGEKYTVAGGVSTLSFSFSGKSGFKGSARIMYTRDTLLQILYMTAGKVDKKGWNRFNKSFTMNSVQ